ncbi:MAG: Sulfonate/nitrate/taurine transport system substrate-binding protein [Acetothermia bacterium 64_32]|nr:MAG: Sulfonate/nitrate/taurine transport system substrate-binding protein [Acetothermia bacterium 64_32]HAF71237.1 hypothetical protein [Candidatus Acetothermia bacterium]
MLKRMLAAFFFLLVGAGGGAAPLRISLPPLLGAVPVALGVAWEMFEEEGVEVKLIPLASQRDRLVAFQAGQIDGMVTDLTSAIMLAAQMPGEVAIVSTAYSPAANPTPHLSLIAQGYSGVDDLAELAEMAGGRKVRIAVPRQSDLEFSLDMLFSSQGLEPPEEAYIGQDDLLVNATWVLFGMVACGVLPQPYVDYLLSYQYEGKPALKVLSDFSGIPIPPSVIVFRRLVLAAQLPDVAGFFRAFRRTVERVNSSSREELLTTGWAVAVELFFPGLSPETLSPEARGKVEAAVQAIHIPKFTEPGPVSREVFEQVRVWAEGKGYLAGSVDYDQVVAILGP